MMCTLRYPYRIREYVEKGGTKYHKLAQLEVHVLDVFTKLRSRHEAIHDNDVITCALLKAREIDYEDLKASATWLLNFKRKHHIVSRRVTKLVTDKHAEVANE